VIYMSINKHVSLNQNIKSLGASPTLALNERCKEMKKNGQEVLNLGIGESPFPVPNFIVDSLKQYAPEKTYLPVKGLPELRRAVADYHKLKDGVDVKPDNVLIGPGSKMLMYLLQLSFDGETIVPTPCWVSYVPQTQIMGKSAHLINTSFENKWHMNASQLAELCEAGKDKFHPRLLILNYPGNPDGGTYSAEELKSIAAVARKHEIIVLSDEIYAELHHKGEHVSIAKYYPEGTIISSGISKWAAAGGWRLGTFTFPDELGWLREAITDVASQTYSSVTSPIQWAGVTAYKGGDELDNYLLHVRRIFRELSNNCADMLRQSGARVHPPEGGFYLFPDFSPLAANMEKRGIRTGKEMCEAILNETHVATIPGSAFSRPDEEFTFRMSYVNFDGDKALAASEAVPLDKKLPDGFLEAHCSKTLEATQRICDFMNRGA
jgi:aspartate aminotransferase